MDFINFLRNVNRNLYDQSDKNALQRLARALAPYLGEAVAPQLDREGPNIVAAARLIRSS